MIITDKSKLEKECKDVSLFEAIGIINKLEEELKSSKIPGIGLAANQIGVDAKVCIIRAKDKINLVNPIITKKYDLSLFRNEGCLSFPNQYIVTKRYNEIVITDLFHPAGLILVGIQAVIAQHEIGHLYGETMFDYQITEPSGPNMPCWCNSGRKFKKCCSKKEVKILY
jgi:peptide deformylase